MIPEVDPAIEKELQPRENVLWAGRPAQGVRLRRSDALLIPFSLLWGGFAVFWEWQALSMGAPLHFALFGVPFVLIGMYIIFGRFLVDSWQRSRTRYALTSARAIIVCGRETHSLSLGLLGSVALREGRGSLGTVQLGPYTGRPGMEWLAGSAWPGIGRFNPPMFEMIEDARRVHGLVLSAQHAAATGRG
ncbi:MAG TPA: hypothetical protein VFC90_00260 [Planctomycetota bacterium]|nr:hypothetical protein [Planctomycetota bacterium]